MGSPTPATWAATFRGTRRLSTAMADARICASVVVSAIRATVVEANDRGAGSSASDDVSCSLESSASNVRT